MKIKPIAKNQNHIRLKLWKTKPATEKELNNLSNKWGIKQIKIPIEFKKHIILFKILNNKTKSSNNKTQILI